MPSVKIPNGAGGWIKIPTVKGDAGTITSVTLTSGNHAAVYGPQGNEVEYGNSRL